MSNGEQRPQAGSDDVPQDEVGAEEQPEGTASSTTEAKPAWLDGFAWSLLGKLVAVSLTTALLLLLARDLRQLLWLMVVASFFAIAMIPGVEHIHRNWGWRRGAAVGVIYVAVVAFFAIMVLVLIPAIEDFAHQVRADGGGWVDQVNDLSRQWLGKDLVGEETGDQAAVVTQSSLQGWSDNVLGMASSGVDVVFSVTIVAMFAFYFAADYPQIEHALLSRMQPDHQRVYSWVLDTSIQQTGAYFYSRLLLTLINAVLSCCVMLILGLSLSYALPLAVFMGFASQFIPVIGTYVGACIPILAVLALEGPAEAVILLVWVVLYQAVENNFLSPKISAKTMEVPGAVAFGASLAGGAIAGPMGAFMALPFAALITAVLRNSGKRYEVVYRSPHGDAAPEAVTDEPT